MLDENDNDPKFSDDIIDASMKENEAHGTLVDTITTTDADSPANTRLTYSINNTDFFTINENTGNITTNR